MSDSRLTVALGEYDTGWHDPAGSLSAAERLVARAASVGAELVALPETATTGFTMETDRAVPIDSSDVGTLRRMAREHNVWLVAGVALVAEENASCAVNAAIAIDPQGEIAAIHRKRRLFAYGGEDKSYTPGDSTTIIDVNGVRIALFICYELRFSEVFAPAAADCDAMLLIANWPAARQQHWDALLRARAIENQCYMVGVNRTGVADGLAYVGGSTVFDPWGDRATLSPAGGQKIVTLDAGRTAEVRAKYPFQRDREIVCAVPQL